MVEKNMPPSNTPAFWGQKIIFDRAFTCYFDRGREKTTKGQIGLLSFPVAVQILLILQTQNLQV
jgi:hypothetical protein